MSNYNKVAGIVCDVLHDDVPDHRAEIRPDWKNV
jgi:hypothetical protein